MKKVVKTWLTVLAALVVLVAIPGVFLGACYPAFYLMASLVRTSNLALYLLPGLGAVALGIWWSIFAAVQWKSGNIGIRIGLTAIVWALVAAVVFASFAVPIVGQFPSSGQ